MKEVMTKLILECDFLATTPQPIPSQMHISCVCIITLSARRGRHILYRFNCDLTDKESRNVAMEYWSVKLFIFKVKFLWNHTTFHTHKRTNFFLFFLSASKTQVLMLMLTIKYAFDNRLTNRWLSSNIIISFQCWMLLEHCVLSHHITPFMTALSQSLPSSYIWFLSHSTEGICKKCADQYLICCLILSIWLRWKLLGMAACCLSLITTLIWNDRSKESKLFQFKAVLQAALWETVNLFSKKEMTTHSHIITEL